MVLFVVKCETFIRAYGTDMCAGTCKCYIGCVYIILVSDSQTYIFLTNKSDHFSFVNGSLYRSHTLPLVVLAKFLCSIPGDVGEVVLLKQATDEDYAYTHGLWSWSWLLVCTMGHEALWVFLGESRDLFTALKKN